MNWCMDHNNADDPARGAANWLYHFIKTNTIQKKLHWVGVSLIAQQATWHLSKVPQGQWGFCSTSALWSTSQHPHKRSCPVQARKNGAPFSVTFHFSIVVSSHLPSHCISLLHHVPEYLKGGEQNTQVAYRWWLASRETFENRSCNQMPVGE